MSAAVAHGFGRAGTEPGTAARLVHADADGGDWPHTRRALPWLLAGFLAMLWLVPFQAVLLPISLPVESTLDRFALVIVAGFWVAALVTRRSQGRPRFRKSPMDPAIVAFLAVALFSVLLNMETLAILDEVSLAFKKLAILLSFAVFFYIVATAIRPSELPAISAFIVMLGSITALGVIYEYRSGTNLFYDWSESLFPSAISVEPAPHDPEFGRELISGPTAHAIAAATLLAMTLPFAITGLMRAGPTRQKVLYGVATMLIIGACFATVRRTGAVGPAAALAVLFLYRPRQMLRLLPLGLLMAIPIQVMAPDAIVRVKAQFVGGFFQDRSVVGRTEDYDPVGPDVVDKLAFGRGHGTFDATRYRFLDNEYLGRVIETGVVGAVIYLLLILTAIRVAHRPARSKDPLRAPLGIAIAAALVAYGVVNIVFDALSFPQAPYMFFFMAGLAVAATPRAPAPAPTDDQEDPSDVAESLEDKSAASTEVSAPPGEVSVASRERSVPPQEKSTPVSGRAQSREDNSAPGLAYVQPDLSVIVVTHNGRDKALATLRHARANDIRIRTEWFVVDSGSSDGTPEAIEREWGDAVKVLRLPNVGFAAANNLALQAVRGRYVLLLNPDVEIRDDSLSFLVSILDKRPRVGAASVVQRSPDGRLLPSIGRFPTPGRQLGEALWIARLPGLARLQEMEIRHRRYARERPADWLVGAFLVVRREALEQVGGLDERFFLYSEEKDLCKRVGEAGWDVRHLPYLEVVHHTGGYDRPGLTAQLTYSKLLFAEKHFGFAQRQGIRGALILRHLVRAVRFGLSGRPEAQARARNEWQALTVTLGNKAPKKP